MPIIVHNNHHYLYLHIPKTGGTTINHWLGSVSTRLFYSGSPPSAFKVTPQHLPLGDFRVLFPDDWFKWKFAIVRNPYDRMESEYFYLTHNFHKRTGRRPHFSTWVVNNLDNLGRNPFLHDNHLRPQIDFLDQDVRVFRFEDGLMPAALEIATTIGLTPPDNLPVTNSRPREEVSWTLEALNKFEDVYARDLEMLGYPKRSRQLDIAPSPS